MNEQNGGAPETGFPNQESQSSKGSDPKADQSADEKKDEREYDASGLDPSPDIPGTDKPLYGQMLSQYPGYDPYIFGAPDSPTQPKEAPKEENPFSDARGGPNPGNPQQGAFGAPGQQQPPSQQNQNPQFGQRPFEGNSPYGFTGLGPNPANPYAQRGRNAQNSYQGKMDGFAVISFVASILGIWFVGLPMGIFSLARIRQINTRGKGLAIAAIVISCLYIILDIALFLMGITDQQIISWISQKFGMGSDSGLQI